MTDFKKYQRHLLDFSIVMENVYFFINTAIIITSMAL